MKKRIALIGAGAWGRNLLRTLRAEGVLAAVASKNPETASLLGPETSLFSDWREMLAKAELDGLVIATPPDAQFEIALTALARGLPLLLEKPLALSRTKALALEAAAKATPVLVDHIHLFHPAYQALREALPKLGKIEAIRSAGGNDGPFRTEINALWDYGPHDLSLAIDLLGQEPRVLSCREEKGNFTVEADFQGTRHHFRVGNAFPAKERFFELKTEAGTLLLNDLAADKLTLNGQALPFLPAPPLTLCVRNFLEGAQDRRWGFTLAKRVVGALEDASVLAHQP